MAQLSTHRANTGLNDRQTYKQIDGHWKYYQGSLLETYI